MKRSKQMTVRPNFNHRVLKVLCLLQRRLRHREVYLVLCLDKVRTMKPVSLSLFLHANDLTNHQVLLPVQDPALKNLMMAWYYAGYYTGLHEGRQQATKHGQVSLQK